MRCTTPGCEGTGFVASTTAYLTIVPGTGPAGEPTAEITGLACEEIELACRTCGQPVDDTTDCAYDTAVRNLINELLRELGLPLTRITTRTRPEPADPVRPEPGSPAGSCVDCGKPLFWNRTADRLHNKWGNYICTVTHRVHRTGNDPTQ